MLDGEGEVGVWERLILQREVPPFGVERFKTVTEHGVAQEHSVGELCSRNGASDRRLAIVAGVLARLGIATEIGMALRSELVEGATHINLLRRHVEECQVDGATSGMAALLVDIFLFEEHALIEVGIEIGLHQRTGKQGRGLQISVDAGSHEIIGAEIADLEDGIGHGIRQGNKLTGILSRRNRRLIIVRCKDTYFLDKRTKETKKLMFLCTYV